MQKPGEIIDGLMAAAERYYGQDSEGRACVAYNPQEGIVEPGLFLYPPESFVTLPIRGETTPQWNIETARKELYPQIREKVIQ